MKVGDALGVREFSVTLPDLVRYAGAGGDFNPIHWNRRVAQSVGLPDVIAHGMLTMAQVARYVTDWAGDPTALESFNGRFSAPVVVRDDGTGATVAVAGSIVAIGEGSVTLALSATSAGVAVLQDAQAVVRANTGS